jgi:hypothetical protein
MILQVKRTGTTKATRISAGLVAAALIVAMPGRAEDEPKLEPGYVSLFNGKDLTGWRYGKLNLEGKTQTPDKRFEVKDGIILVHAKDAKGRGGVKDLYTVQNFPKDFHLKLEFRAAPRADSGVYIRGPQLQVRDYPTVGPYKKVRFNKDGWNELDITVKGVTALCKCNGEVIEKAMRVPPNGGIGLQAETGAFAYRRIRIKMLR